jgi:hypothetical protein
MLIAAATVADALNDYLSRDSGSKSVDYKTALELFDGVLRDMKDRNPQFRSEFERNEGSFRDMLVTSIKAYVDQNIEYSDHYRADLEARVKYIGQASDAIDFVIDNKTPVGIAISVVACVLGALLGVVVALPQTDNFYRELKLACTQITVGVVKGVVDATIAAIGDVLAIVSSVLLLLPRLLGGRDFVENTPVLREMHQLSARRVGAYFTTYEDFAKFGLVVKLVLMGSDIKNLSDRDNLRFLQMMDRVSAHHDQYPDYEGSIKSAIERVCDRSPEYHADLIKVLYNHQDYLRSFGADFLASLKAPLEKLSLNPDLCEIRDSVLHVLDGDFGPDRLGVMRDGPPQ